MSINKSSNNKVPLVALYSKRKNTEKTPQKQSNTCQFSFTNTEGIYVKKSTTKHNYNTRRNKEEILKNMELDNLDEYGNKEYNALKDALDTNARLLEENSELKEEIQTLKKDGGQKEIAMLDLFNYYEHCQKHHSNSFVANCLNSKNLRTRFKKPIWDSN